MDTFFEQIVPIKNNAKRICLFILIWLAAFLIDALLFMVLPYFAGFSMIILLAAVGVVYGAFKLSSMLNVEYEYILTNGEMDIDKITAKSSRRRMVTFKCQDIERIEKYNFAAPVVISGAKTEIYCNIGDENACFVLINHAKRGKVAIVFAPNQRMKSEMSTYISRIIAGDFFK